MNKMKLEYQMYSNNQLIDEFKCIARYENKNIIYTDKDKNQMKLTFSNNEIEIIKSGVINYRAMHKKDVYHLMTITLNMEEKQNQMECNIYTNDIIINKEKKLIIIDFDINGDNQKIIYKIGGNNVFEEL